VYFCDKAHAVKVTVHDIEIGLSVGLFLERQGIVPTFHVGIFGKRVSMDDILTPGDRVEIYEPLRIDPKQSRLKKLGKKYV
jgi:putative ubiquitin-RnfH superfamily antitoxin RatB of RatAB toxin-antitoxin module